MLRSKKLIAFLSIAFAVAEIGLSLMIQGVFGNSSSYVSYFSVVLACLFVAILAERSASYDLTQIAMIMTVAADYFLVVIPVRQQLLAMIFFSIAQIAYFLRLYLATESPKMRRLHLFMIAFVSIFAIVLTIIVLKDSVDAVSLISMFYFANLITNIVFAFAEVKKHFIFAVGLLFFACCDVFVGFSFIEDYIEIIPGSFADKLAHPRFNVAWAFYVPSQTLIALSLLHPKD